MLKPLHLACLMAGIGSRLRPHTLVHHKALVAINGRRLLDYQLDSFRNAGMTGASFVVGHGAEEMSQYLFRALPTTSFSITYNPDYAAKNLDWSAYLALAHRQGPTIYYEGDLLVPPSLLAELNASPADICLAIDPRRPSERVDTLVTLANGKPKHLLLYEHGNAPDTLDPSVAGEFVCLLKLSERGRGAVVRQLEKQPFVGGMQLYHVLEQAFGSVETSFVDVGGRPWVEVDNASDLARAARLAESIVNS